MAVKKKQFIAGAAVAALAVAGVIAVGTTAFADPTPTASPSAGATAGTQDAGKGQGQGRGGSHSAVTGDEAQKVIDAVQAKNTGVTITEVRKDPDGSYDALGTKADGTKVFYDVSTDLATITENTGGPGGKGGGAHTAVTGDEAQKVIDAVQAKNTGVKITEVRKDADGSYDAIGTKADSSKVSYDVSTDLGTITERTR